MSTFSAPRVEFTTCQYLWISSHFLLSGVYQDILFSVSLPPFTPTLPRISSSACPDSFKTLTLYKSCTYLLTKRQSHSWHNLWGQSWRWSLGSQSAGVLVINMAVLGRWMAKNQTATSCLHVPIITPPCHCNIKVSYIPGSAHSLHYHKIHTPYNFFDQTSNTTISTLHYQLARYLLQYMAQIERIWKPLKWHMGMRQSLQEK